MKISEIKERRIIHRPTKYFDKSGNRIYQEFEYDFNFNTHITENYSSRLFAKILDIIPFFLLFCFLISINPLLSFLYSILTVIFLNTILEWKTGQSIGKRVFKLIVVDDFGNFPTFPKSLKRNFLCVINLFPEYYDYQDQAGVWKTRMKFSMQLNSQFSTTYVIKKQVYIEIKNIIKKKTSPRNTLSIG